MIRARVVVSYAGGSSTTVWEGSYDSRDERTFQQLLLDVASTIRKPLRWGMARGIYLLLDMEG